MLEEKVKHLDKFNDTVNPSNSASRATAQLSNTSHIKKLSKKNSEEEDEATVAPG